MAAGSNQISILANLWGEHVEDKVASYTVSTAMGVHLIWHEKEMTFAHIISQPRVKKYLGMLVQVSAGCWPRCVAYLSLIYMATYATIDFVNPSLQIASREEVALTEPHSLHAGQLRTYMSLSPLATVGTD